MTAALSLQNLMAWATQVCVIAIVGALLPLLFRVRHPRSQLIYCHAVLILALVLPVIQPWDHPIVITAKPASAAALAPASAVPVSAPSSSSVSLESAILWILAAGVAFKLTWLGIGLWTVRRYRLSAKPLYPSPQPVSKA